MHNETVLAQYSGVVINQNQAPLADSHWMVPGTTTYYQEFVLPPGYQRGTDNDELVVPPLTGLQVMVGIDEEHIDDAVVIWTLEHKSFGDPWQVRASGTTVGAHAWGDKVWMDLMTDDGVEINAEMLEDRYRYSIKTINVAKVWYSQPNPLALTSTSARTADGVTAYSPNGVPVSFCFRVLGLTADEGTDFLGNVYRSAILTATPHNVSTVDGDVDKIWMSKPNPSRFAVESLYFDMRTYRPTTYFNDEPEAPVLEDEEAVIDRVILDPITPGVYFTVYYTSEGEPGTDPDSWDNKLWKRVPMTYHAEKRDSYIFPEPITAKYIKVEFSHLQARYYSPGDFAHSMAYKKHPRWVLDYFLVYTGAEDALSRVTPGRVAIVHDALDLAYNYYLDDLAQEPEGPVEADSGFLLNSTGTELDRVDADVLYKINLSLAPYRNHPSTFAKSDYLIGAYAQAAAEVNPSYPVERAPTSPTRFDDVSVLRNTQVRYEQNMPVMFFYLTARHKYKEVTAPFSYNRAYFVGIREIAFTRENYTVAFDSTQYVEPAGDLLNVERNDFVTRDGVMEVQ